MRKKRDRRHFYLKTVSVSFFLFVIAFSGCYSQNQNNIIGKEIAGEPYAWDFGQVKEGVVVQHDFVFKNETQKILKIKDVDTSCGCTVSQVEKKVLVPGESTIIEVKLDTKGDSGAIQQYVYVNTDNLDNPILRLIIKAYIIK